MIEVELKYRLDDPEDFLARLLARGAVPAGELVERDLYFAHPVRDFAATNEALRVRWDGRAATMTYKGPLLDAVSKSREECEVDLAGEAPVDEATRLLERLGFRPVRVVEKRRTKFHVNWQGRDVTATIDDVTDVGVYVELEVIAADADWEPARDSLQSLAKDLGLRNPERRSYLELLIESKHPSSREDLRHDLSGQGG